MPGAQAPPHTWYAGLAPTKISAFVANRNPQRGIRTKKQRREASVKPLTLNTMRQKRTLWYNVILTSCLLAVWSKRSLSSSRQELILSRRFFSTIGLLICNIHSANYNKCICLRTEWPKRIRWPRLYWRRKRRDRQTIRHLTVALRCPHGRGQRNKSLGWCRGTARRSVLQSNGHQEKWTLYAINLRRWRSQIWRIRPKMRKTSLSKELSFLSVVYRQLLVKTCQSLFSFDIPSVIIEKRVKKFKDSLWCHVCLKMQ